jgi:predicted GIY-YIG superfamily endonuclease
MRYDNGKIYRITNNIDNMIYIGSTCLPLRKRLYSHKKEQHSRKGQNRRLFLS